MNEHLCVVCPVRRRTAVHYERAQVCNSCRDWLAALPGQIVALWVRLADYDLLPDLRTYEVTHPLIGPLLERQTRPIIHTGEWLPRDPVASTIPTAANGARVGGDMVTGSREAPGPVNLDLIDLALPVHGDNLTAHGKHWAEDQIGHVPVAQELDLLVREWAEDRGEHLPAPTVPALAGWLADRTDWACDHHPGIDHAATQLQQLRGTLRGVLGDGEPRPDKMAAPCPGCDQMTLVRRPGEDKMECADRDCLRVLTADEYALWSGLVATAEAERAAEPAARRSGT